jgi:hypothetical protein
MYRGTAWRLMVERLLILVWGNGFCFLLGEVFLKPMASSFWISFMAVICFGVSGGKLLGAEKVRLFVLSGQSNMAGLNPDDTFTPTVRRAFPEDEMIIVHYAEGGTAIRRWWPGWKDDLVPLAEGVNPPPGDLYRTLIDRVNAGIRGKTLESVALIWMQGERDAKSGLSAFYEEALRGLLKQAATDLKRPELVVVIGRLTDHRKGEKHWDAIREIQEKVAGSSPRWGWVDSDDLNGEKNDLHCTKEGYHQLGQRFASKAIALLSSGDR